LLAHEGIIKPGFYTRLSMNVVVRLVTADAVIVRHAILVFARVHANVSIAVVVRIRIGGITRYL
jgi:hypothetical protein